MAETTKATSKGLKAAFKGVPTPVLIAVPVVAGLAFYLWNKKKAASATAAAANDATTGSTTTGTTSTGTSYSTDGGYGTGGGQFGYPDNLGSVLQNLQGQVSALQNNPTTSTPANAANTTSANPNPVTVVGTATGTQANTGAAVATPTVTPQPNVQQITPAISVQPTAPAASPATILPTNVTSVAQENAALTAEQQFLANQAAISAQQKANLANLVNNSPLPGLIPIPAGNSTGTSSPVTSGKVSSIIAKNAG